MTLYLALRYVKLIAVLVYGSGVFGGLFAKAADDRKWCVHSLASPALIVTWLTGYAMSTQLNVAMTELWILVGLLTSAVSLICLMVSTAREWRRVPSLLTAVGPLLLALGFMVFRPTWGGLRLKGSP